MTDRKLVSLITVIIIGGFGGIVAQTILLREMLILFSGNELSIGMIIGSWVIWEAAGSFSGGRWNRKNSMDILILSMILFSICLPASIYLTRIFKTVANMDPGVGVGLLPIFYSSAIILLPAGFLHGFFFILACRAYDEITGEGTLSTGKVYFIEMTGTIAGGLMVSYLFIVYLNSFETAVIIALLNAMACLLFALTLRRSIRNLTSALSICLLLCSLLLLGGNGSNMINAHSLKRQWPGQNIVYYGNSHYQNIVVVQDEEQYTFFSNGMPALTAPVPDITFVEEFVHYSMLAHPLPEKILIIGGGAGGPIKEMLKYPCISKIDYVEIDPLLLKVIRRFSTPLTEGELENPLVKLHYVDGKRFLTEISDKYDEIFLGLPPPYTLQANRFFTEEFFLTAKARLNPGGILTLAMPGSLAYYSKELKELNVSMIRTLKNVFSNVFVLPGDFNLFLASDNEEITSISPAILFGRLTGYGIRTNLLTSYHMKYRFEESRQRWFRSVMNGIQASINRDFSPKGLFYYATYINILFSPYLRGIFDCAKRIDIFHSLSFISVIFIILFFTQKKWNNTGTIYAIASTGFAAMLVELMLLFCFQIFYGYIYHEIGILVTTFMTGMAAGGLSAVLFLNRIKKPFAAFIYTETAIALFCIILFLILLYPGSDRPFGTLPLRAFFLCLLFISGFIPGMEFPIANKVYRTGNTGRTAGILYGADLLGGWIGGISGGIILLPVLGLSNGCIALTVLKISSLVLLLTSNKK